MNNYHFTVHINILPPVAQAHSWEYFSWWNHLLIHKKRSFCVHYLLYFKKNLLTCADDFIFTMCFYFSEDFKAFQNRLLLYWKVFLLCLFEMNVCFTFLLDAHYSLRFSSSNNFLALWKSWNPSNPSKEV